MINEGFKLIFNSLTNN